MVRHFGFLFTHSIRFFSVCSGNSVGDALNEWINGRLLDGLLRLAGEE
jgi:hypothetical protein